MEYSGPFDSHGAPQFFGNTFSTASGQIHFNSNIDNKTPKKICELPTYVLSHNFVGRQDELARIDEMLKAYSGDPPRRCVIHGMPGLGKTQLALKFASLAFEDSRYPYVFWVSAASEEKLTQDFSKLAHLLRLPGHQTMDRASMLTAVRAWLEDPNEANNWLIVLDNASEETAATLRDILPRGDCQGSLLMTTRTGAIADMFTASRKSAQLALKTIKIVDALALLSASASSDGESKEYANDRHAQRLVRLVGKLPLAIDQAASFMRESGCSPQEVMDVYESDEASEILSWENDLSAYETKSVASTFTPALQRLQETAPDAATLLRIFSFCDPEAIPISMFRRGCDAIRQGDHQRIPDGAQAGQELPFAKGLDDSLEEKSSAARQKTRPALVKTQEYDALSAVQDVFRSPTRLSKAVQEIQHMSLAVHTMDGSERIMRIHDLVHFLLRSKLMTDAERVQWLEAVILVVCEAFKELGDPESPDIWSQYGRYISHIESLEGFAERYKSKNVEILRASTIAAKYLWHCGLFEKAATLAERIYKKQMVVCGEHDISTMLSLNQLANALSSQGKYEEGEVLARKVLALRKSVIGKNHPDTLISISNLALTLQHQGKYEEAEKLNREALALRKSVLGKKHRHTLVSMSNLAMILGSQGGYEETEELNRETLALRKSVLGKNHPDTLMSIGNLATVLGIQGKFEEAEEMTREALVLRKSVLGKNHPDTLMSMSNLAVILERQGKYEEAEEMTGEALALRKSVLGTEHPDTLMSMNNLAWTWHKQGRVTEAISLMGPCFQLRTQVLGPKHPDTEKSRGWLGRWKSERDEQDRAQDQVARDQPHT